MNQRWFIKDFKSNKNDGKVVVPPPPPPPPAVPKVASVGTFTLDYSKAKVVS